MITGKTNSGFEFEIEEKRLENYELAEVLAEVDSNPLLMPRVVNLLLGKQAEDLKNHVRDEEGLVSSTRIGEEIEDIFKNVEQLKNS